MAVRLAFGEIGLAPPVKGAPLVFMIGFIVGTIAGVFYVR